MPGTTTALRIRDHSGTLHLLDVGLTEPDDREVTVELTYAGVNPVDSYIAQGMVSPDGPVPRTLGGEAAGTLDGRPVLVAGAGLGSTRDGVWARQAVVPREAVLPLPAGVDPQQAASAGVAGLTAWSTVVEVAGVSAADRVVVLGASGGVGLPIVALAASYGAEVWGQTRSGEHASALTELGATGALVTDAEGLADALGSLRPTVVIDALGGDYVSPALGALAPYGRYVVFGTTAGADVQLNWQAVYRSSLSVLGYGGLVLDADERRRRLQHVLRALAEGRMTIPVSRTVPLKDGTTIFDTPEDAPPGKTLLQLS